MAGVGVAAGAQRRAPLPASPRLYVFDCGRLEGGDVSRFRLTRQEMATTDMSVACYLVAHPRGTLDLGRRRGARRRHRSRGRRRRVQTVPARAAEQGRAVRDGDTDAEVAAGRGRLRAGRHHLPRAVALPLRPHGQRQPLRRVDVARAPGRTRRDVRRRSRPTCCSRRPTRRCGTARRSQSGRTTTTSSATAPSC